MNIKKIIIETLYDYTKNVIKTFNNLNFFLEFQGRQAVVSEFYDEIVFQDPTQTMHSLLKNAR